MTNCPANDELARLALGTLPDAAAEPIEEHLLGCPDCMRRLAELRLDDPLLDGLRLQQSIAKTDPSELSAEFRGLLAGTAERPTLASGIDATDQEASGASPAGGDDRSAQAGGSPALGGQRFRFLRPHAKGGLGEVSVAMDETLQREVALKEIQECLRDAPREPRSVPARGGGDGQARASGHRAHL